MSEQQLDKNASLEQGKSSSDEMEIDLMDILRNIISIRKALYKAAGIGLFIGVIIALSIPKQYTVKVTLSPEMGSYKGNSGIAGFAASFLGGGSVVGETTDALNASLSPDIVSSTPFLLELIKMEVPISNNKVTLESYLSGQSSPWWSYIIGFPNLLVNWVRSLFEDIEPTTKEIQNRPIELSKKESENIKYLRRNIYASVDKKTAVTSVSVTLKNPNVTAVVADSVIKKLQEYIINYRTSKAMEDSLYLKKLFIERQNEYYVTQRQYAEYVDSHDNLILQSIRVEQERLQNDMNLAYQIYSQVANQLQVARAKVQEEKPIFAVIEPAVVPLKASSMGVKSCILLFIIISVVCTIGWKLFGKKIMDSLKNEVKYKS